MVVAAPYAVERGQAHRLGAVPDAQGVNFSVFSEHATAVELLLFDKHDDVQPFAGHRRSIRGSTRRSISGTSTFAG